MKLNNKGFAVSTILYGLLALIILILLMLFGIMKSSKDQNEDLVENLTNFMNYCVAEEVALESCYFNNLDDTCGSYNDAYKKCIEEIGVSQ